MSTLKKQILIVFYLICCTSLITLQAQSPIHIEYKFSFGEQLKYQVEQQDSIETQNQNVPVEDTETAILTYSLLVSETPPDKVYQIEVTQDTLSLVNSPKFKPNLIEKQINQILNNAQEGLFTFSSRGEFRKRKALCLPVVFPLPEKPVTMNDIWNFDIETRSKKNGTCRGRITGEGIVYNLYVNNDTTLMTIILNTQTDIKGKFKFREIHLRLSGEYTITETATHIVYFNVTAGRVERIVSENNIVWQVDSKAMQSTKKIKRKATIKLINQP